MKKLDVENSVAALFALSYDVSRLSVNGKSFFYISPKKSDSLKVIRYILRANNIKSRLHWSRYYTPYGEKQLVVRVPVDSFFNSDVLKFSQIFEQMYIDKYENMNKVDLDKKDTRLFNLSAARKKAMLVNRVANMIK